MADYTELFSEIHSLLISENNPTLPAGTYDTAWVSASQYHRLVAILNVVDMGAGATLDFSIRQATDTAGTGAKVIAGKAATQLTQAGGDVDSDVAVELQTEELDVTNGFDCINLRLVVAVAAVVVSYRLYGRVPRYQPVGTTAWTEVIQ